MSKKYKAIYPYAWLDEVIEVTLNPAKTNVTKIETPQLKIIEAKFIQELADVVNQLKANTFYLLSTKKLKVLVSQYYKSLSQLKRQATANLDAYPPEHPLVLTGECILLNLQEIEFILKQRYGQYIEEIADKSIDEEISSKDHIPKVTCRLSVDQIGIILRAADDIRLIIASSISIIFRRIVPFLATEKTKVISWNSMRKSSYQIEQSDKDIAVAMLEKMIERIKHY